MHSTATTRWAPALAMVAFLEGMPCVLGEEAISEDAAPRSFEPGDIAIGEPIPLPFTAPRSEIAPPSPRPAAPAASEPRSLLSDSPAPLASVAPRARGTGWIGLQVTESSEPGRWAIADVAVGSPATSAGINVGDELRAIDGVQIKNDEDVAQAFTSFAPGQRVTLAIARGGQVVDISIVATERPVAVASRTWQAASEPAADASPLSAPPAFVPAPPPAQPQIRPAAPLPVPASPSSPTGRTALGVRTVPIDLNLQTRFNLPAAAGAYVIGVVQDLPASRAGVPPGSVIVSLDNLPVRSPDELTRLVTAGPIGRPVTLQYILPGGASHRADVMLQALERPLEAALIGPDTPSPTAVPQLQPGPPPTTMRRPASGGQADAAEAIKAEVRDLRSRLELLEKQLEMLPR